MLSDVFIAVPCDYDCDVTAQNQVLVANATIPVSGNFIRKLNFVYNLTFKHQMILKEAIFGK